MRNFQGIHPNILGECKNRKIYFKLVERTERLGIQSDLGKWHAKHGIVYVVYDCPNDGGECTVIGQCYLTLLAYSGAIIHFEINENWNFNPAVLLASFRKAMIFIPGHFNILLATIQKNRTRLIRIAQRLGFVPVPDMEYVECGKPVTVLRCQMKTGKTYGFNMGYPEVSPLAATVFCPEC